MFKNLTLLTVLIVAASCSDKSQPEGPHMPWSGEWIPVTYTMKSDKAVHTVNECTDNIRDFSPDLDRFLSGNVFIGEPEPNINSPSGVSSGSFTWTSRCDATDTYEGTWNSLEYGATVALNPATMPDSTLQFQAIGLWKLTYAIGEDAVTINYTLKRK